jgi:hypothetical protein
MTVRHSLSTSGVCARQPFSKRCAQNSCWLATLVTAVLLMLVVGGPAQAAFMNWPNHVGATVDYTNVFEDSGAGNPLRFGQPNFSGDSIDYNPTGFEATSSGGGGVIVDSEIGFMVRAHVGQRIFNFKLNEIGDTTLVGVVPLNSNGTGTAVFANGVLDISEVDFQPINNISVPFNLQFNPSNGDFYLGIDGAGGPVYNKQWQGGVTLNIDNIIKTTPGTGLTFPPSIGVTKITITLDNTLTAFSQLNTSAQIAKKDFDGVSIEINVPGNGIPEPASLLLAGLSLVGLCFRRGCRG